MRQDAPLVEGGKVSNRKCWDFTGQKYAAMSKEGSTWMCFTDPGDKNYKVNESQTMKVWTQTAKQITDQILSVPRTETAENAVQPGTSALFGRFYPNQATGVPPWCRGMESQV